MMATCDLLDDLLVIVLSGNGPILAFGQWLATTWSTIQPCRQLSGLGHLLEEAQLPCCLEELGSFGDPRPPAPEVAARDLSYGSVLLTLREAAADLERSEVKLELTAQSALGEPILL
mmetsp:Transcript_41950/g.77952  ORF Transcript_41950/g.77952 Transcript_41950/m.77952 type:complete len:117 (-) Transcript_41950:8-358(-)